MGAIFSIFYNFSTDAYETLTNSALITRLTSLEQPLIGRSAISQTQMILEGIYDEENPPPQSPPLVRHTEYPPSLLDAFIPK